MVVLNIISVLKGKDKKRADAWSELISSELGSEYTQVATEYMVGQYITMFAKEEIFPHLS